MNSFDTMSCKIAMVVSALMILLFVYPGTALSEEPRERLTFEATKRNERGFHESLYGHEIIRGYDYKFGRLFVSSPWRINYGKLREGTAFPLAGAIYRVESVSRQKIELVKVAGEKIPKHMKLHAGSRAIPVRCIRQGNGISFRVNSIANRNGKPSVSITGYPNMTGTYHVSDSINFYGNLYRILNIVPPEGMFVGWIELDSKPRKGPIPRLKRIKYRHRKGTLEILPEPGPGSIPGNYTSVTYRDMQRKQEMIDFLVKHKGCIVAFWGRIYRITQADAKHITCEPVPETELPTGSAKKEGSTLLSVGRTNAFGQSTKLRVAKISTDGKVPTATLEVTTKTESKSKTYKIGDEIIINKKARRIINIVPSNEAKKLIGWVEMSHPKGLSK